VTLEEIRKQMMGSAGLYEASLSETHATKSSADTKTVELPAVVTSVGPEDEQDHFAEDHQSGTVEVANPQQSEVLRTKNARSKSMALAVVLALILGPFGLLYVPWKRAAVMLLVFVVGVSLIPKNGFVVLLLWLVTPILSIILLGVGKRQPPAA